MYKKLIIALFLAFVTTAASAQMYGGLDYSVVDVEAGELDAEPTALRLRAGSEFNENFALEGHVGFGLSDDSVDTVFGDVDVEIDNFFGVYGKGILPLSETFRAYGLVGFTRGEATVSGAGGSESDDETDLSYGIGANLRIGERLSLQAEYMQVIDKSSFEISTLSLGVDVDF